MPTQKPQFIAADEARSLFRKYHGFSDTDPNPQMSASAGSLEVLVGEVMQKVACVLLDVEMLDDLKALVSAPNFAGIAAFPAMHPDNSFTMIFAALEKDGTGVKIFYPPTLNQATHIYDYVHICPDNCPTNIGITLGGWKE